MSRQPTIFFFGVLFVIGLIIQIVTSVTWINFENENFGYGWFMCGQAVGELCYIFGLRRLFKGMGFFVAITEFAISLILVDIYSIILMNPLEISLPKYAGFIIATMVLIARFKSYKQDE